MKTNPSIQRVAYRAVREQGARDGREWARDYAGVGELRSLRRYMDQQEETYAKFAAHINAFAKYGEDAPVSKELELKHDIAWKAYSESRHGIDPLSHSLLTFLQERRGRPVMVPDALLIPVDTMIDPYWSCFIKAALDQAAM